VSATVTFRYASYSEEPRARYSRGPWLAVTRSTSRGHYFLQWYWGDGCGSHRYNPPIPGVSFARRKDAEAEKRKRIEAGEHGEWIEWPGTRRSGDR
jgi:hypothetical protein